MEIKLPKAEKIKRIDSKYVVLALCISISLIFWLIRKLSEEHTVSIPYVLEYELPQGFSPGVTPIKQIEAKVTARGWQILSLDRKGGLLLLDLELATDSSVFVSGTQIMDAITNQEAVRNMSIDKITPSEFYVTLHKTYQKNVPVFLNADIDFYPDHDLRTPIIIEPDSVVLYGPEELLDSLTEWPTEYIELSNIKSNIEKIIKLKHPEEESIQLSHQSVILEMDVDEFTEKHFDLPVEIVDASGSLLTNYRVIPNRALIYTVLPLTYYEEVSKEEFKLVVEVNESQSSIPARRQKLKLSLYPNQIKSYKIHPNTVELYKIVE